MVYVQHFNPTSRLFFSLSHLVVVVLLTPPSLKALTLFRLAAASCKVRQPGPAVAVAVAVAGATVAGGVFSSLLTLTVLAALDFLGLLLFRLLLAVELPLLAFAALLVAAAAALVLA